MTNDVRKKEGNNLFFWPSSVLIPLYEHSHIRLPSPKDHALHLLKIYIPGSRGTPKLCPPCMQHNIYHPFNITGERSIKP
jgi:hypothetical protein